MYTAYILLDFVINAENRRGQNKGKGATSFRSKASYF